MHEGLRPCGGSLSWYLLFRVNEDYIIMIIILGSMLLLSVDVFYVAVL